MSANLIQIFRSWGNSGSYVSAGSHIPVILLDFLSNLRANVKGKKLNTCQVSSLCNASRVIGRKTEKLYFRKITLLSTVLNKRCLLFVFLKKKTLNNAKNYLNIHDHSIPKKQHWHLDKRRLSSLSSRELKVSESKCAPMWK